MMSQDLRNQKPDVDNPSDIRVKQSPNGELKQFLKQPFGIALAMILIVLLSGTTFVVGKASVSRSFCIASFNCQANTDNDIGGNTSAKAGKNGTVNIEQPSTQQKPSEDHWTEIAIGVGAIAIALWWIVLL